MSKWLCRSCNVAFDRLWQLEEHDFFDCPCGGRTPRHPAVTLLQKAVRRFARWAGAV